LGQLAGGLERLLRGLGRLLGILIFQLGGADGLLRFLGLALGQARLRLGQLHVGRRAARFLVLGRLHQFLPAGAKKTKLALRSRFSRQSSSFTGLAASTRRHEASAMYSPSACWISGQLIPLTWRPESSIATRAPATENAGRPSTPLSNSVMFCSSPASA